jgi:hypothetical protein
MTAHHHFDRLHVNRPPEAPDYSGADLETDGDDLLNWLVPVILYDGNGDLRGVRFGMVKWTNEDLLKAIGREGFSRFEHMGEGAKRRALDDWTAARMEEMGDAE